MDRPRILVKPAVGRPRLFVTLVIGRHRLLVTPCDGPEEGEGFLIFRLFNSNLFRG